MEGFRILFELPEEIKKKINDHYGSVADLYKKVFVLSNEEYQLTRSNSPRLGQVLDELHDIEDKLEEFGVTDGWDLISGIASDFGDLIVKRRIMNLNEHLVQLGTDFDTIRNWLSDKYGI